MATTVATALLDTGAAGVSAVLWGDHPIGAEAIRDATLARSQTDAPRKHIEASLRKWRVNADLATTLDCPYCKELDTNAHYLHFCTEPTVVAARQKHHRLLAAAIHTCEPKKSRAGALTAMYTLDNQGRHIDPGAEGNGVSNALIENLIAKYRVWSQLGELS